jgi:hypothetical protein
MPGVLSVDEVRALERGVEKRRASATAVLSFQVGGDECRTGIGIDLAAESAATPCKEFIGVYNDLLNGLARVLPLFEERLSAAQPMVIVRLDVRVDGAPASPVLSSKP